METQPNRKEKYMGAFDRFWDRDELMKKTIQIDNTLYERLDKLATEKYHTSKNKLINACIEELIKTENINLYEKPEGELTIQHSLLIRKSLFDGLEKLREKYNISIYKLVNISINEATKELFQ